MNKVLIAVLSAAISSVATWFVTKSHYEKKMDALAAKATGDMNKMSSKLEKIHKEFIEAEEDDIAFERQKIWDRLSEETTQTPTQKYTPKTDEEVVDEFVQNIRNASQYNPPKNLQTFLEISEDEFNDEHAGSIYSKETYSYYKSTSELYDPYERRVDEPKHLFGLNAQMLNERVDQLGNFEGTRSFYIRNNETLEDYQILIFDETVCDPAEASLIPAT